MEGLIMYLSITGNKVDQFRASASHVIELSEDITASDLVLQGIIPLMHTQGYHISSIKRALEAGADDIAELEDSIVKSAGDPYET
jgi:hypothetical protein